MKKNLNDSTEIIMLGDSLVEWFYNVSYKNLGHAGYTTRDLMWYIEDCININGELGILLIGVNDILSNFKKEISQKYYADIIKLLEKKFINILIIKLLPTDIVTINNEIEKFNLFIDHSYRNKENIFILDIYHNFLGNINQEKIIADKYTTDGIHLSNAGYELLKKKLEEKISEIFN
ncbi:SGNH/GDSL hydrolase family protein [Fusobacterium sp. PH5-44]|uniref:SGNH/GDSL hydrolase family protein n=1 Tax=unclassified Fusobacterium TaxID=2648384 RepID=UPI003D193ED1